MEEKKETNTNKENFSTRSAGITDMLENPNSFYKNMAALSAVIKEDKIEKQELK